MDAGRGCGCGRVENRAMAICARAHTQGSPRAPAVTVLRYRINEWLCGFEAGEGGAGLVRWARDEPSGREGGLLTLGIGRGRFLYMILPKSLPPFFRSINCVQALISRRNGGTAELKI